MELLIIIAFFYGLIRGYFEIYGPESKNKNNYGYHVSTDTLIPHYDGYNGRHKERRSIYQKLIKRK